MSNRNGWNSRKYRSAWYLTCLMTLLLVAPPTASLILAVEPALILLSAVQYIGFLSIIWTVYFGANVIQKIGTKDVYSKERGLDRQATIEQTITPIVNDYSDLADDDEDAIGDDDA